MKIRDPLSDAEPLNCPFCGKPPVINSEFKGQKSVECVTKGCPAFCVEYFWNIEQAIARWNRRASSASAGTASEKALRMAFNAGIMHSNTCTHPETCFEDWRDHEFAALADAEKKKGGP